MFAKIFIVLLMAVCSVTTLAGLTEDELAKFKKVLPKGMTPKSISAWSETITNKNMEYTLYLRMASTRLTRRSYGNLVKKGKVMIRFIGGVLAGGRRSYKGAMNIYVYSAGDTVKLLAHKKVKLAKLCPT